MGAVRFIIRAVIDVETNKPSEKFGYRVGGECSFFMESLDEVGAPLIVFYPNGSHFRTSRVVDVQECEYGFTIQTRNRIYVFEYL